MQSESFSELYDISAKKPGSPTHVLLQNKSAFVGKFTHKPTQQKKVPPVARHNDVGGFTTKFVLKGKYLNSSSFVPK